MAEQKKKPGPGVPPIPVQPGILLICSNPKCGKPRKNDTYGSLCEDCYCDVPAAVTRAKPSQRK